MLLSRRDNPALVLTAVFNFLFVAGHQRYLIGFRDLLGWWLASANMGDKDKNPTVGNDPCLKVNRGITFGHYSPKNPEIARAGLARHNFPALDAPREFFAEANKRFFRDVLQTAMPMFSERKLKRGRFRIVPPRICRRPRGVIKRPPLFQQLYPQLRLFLHH